MERKGVKLTSLQARILTAIVRYGITGISYRKPKKQFKGMDAKDEEILNALRNMEDNYDFVKLVGSSFLGVNTSTYQIDLKKARKFYDELAFGNSRV